jgi:hypothetical protein
MNDIIKSEENIMDIARAEMSAAFANTFVLTADESGVIMFEKMLNILPNVQTEDLEFRRRRILNRMSMRPPFTFNFLKYKLDEIIGRDAWSACIDFSNYTLYVESSAVNQNWYSEVMFTINSIKPCNMVFINVPYTSANIHVNEAISYTQRNWRYRLGSWKLGQYAFATLDGGGVIKMENTKSIKQALLDDAAVCISNNIASVLLNDTVEISEFTLKQVSENVVCVEYSVMPSMTNLITDIKLRRADGTILTQSTVYVPVTQNIISKHLITVKEGT